MLEEFLALSETLRPGYTASLGTSISIAERDAAVAGVSIPPFLADVYSQVAGTRAGISEQTLMDFIPGYRLIHVQEIAANYQDCIAMDREEGFIPFLANYSSDFFCWNDGSIYDVSHDNPVPAIMHESESKFWETICAFYQRDVYFLDADGFLDYDFDMEKVVASAINPGVRYWDR